jgi:hypothetical protein
MQRLRFSPAKAKPNPASASPNSKTQKFVEMYPQKLEALKTHKKGLMQQLFPSVGGVAGEA